MTNSYSIDLHQDHFGSHSAAFVHHKWAIVDGKCGIVKSRYSLKVVSLPQHLKLTNFVNAKIKSSAGKFKFLDNNPTCWTFVFMDDVYKMGVHDD